MIPPPRSQRKQRARALAPLLLLPFAAASLASTFSGPQPVAGVSVSLTVPVFIEVFLDPTSVSFPPTSPGSTSNASTGFPLNVNITDNTNTPTNVSLRGDGDFNRSGGGASFNMTNLTYSNVSSGGANRSVVPTFNTTDPFPDWVDRPVPPPGTNVTVPVHFWLRIPPGQEAGTYATNVTIRVSPA